MIIDGKAVASGIREQIKLRAKKLADEGRPAGLAVIRIGDDAASEVYVRNKIKGCTEVGISSFSYELPATTSQATVIELIRELNSRDDVHGILVQLPLPKGLDESVILAAIDESKDVDGFSAKQTGLLVLGTPDLVACTPHGCMELIKSTGVQIAGKRAVIVGRSNIVGKPMFHLLLAENATVTVCHSKTRDLAELTRQADILVAALGKPRFVTADMVKEGAVVIDVGINRVDGKLVGDVDFDAVSKKASYITPVPGGVGPMTITMLLYNTVKAAERSVK